jgi:parallel beta-helix repeat protein
MSNELLTNSRVSKKMSAVLLALIFVASAWIGMIAVNSTGIGSNLTEVKANASATMDPGGLPHYFGPYGNFANSPVPTGSVSTITVDSGGAGYSAPVVDVVDVWGTGSGAVASASIANGVITSISISSGGTGYSAPIVLISDTTGSGAAATANLGGPLSGGIRKFVDALPGLGEANANNLGNYIPIAIPDLTTYPGCDYFEIALVKYTQKLHSDLPATLLNGYVQLETPAIAAYSKHIALTNPDGSPILMADGSQAIAVDNPKYLGPTLVASRDIPTRVTFHNLLPTGAGGNLFLPVDSTYMGAGMGPLDMIGMPGMKENYTENRATLHLHGGATPWISDGTPHQWTTPAGETTQYPKGVSVSYVPDMWFVNGAAVPNTVGVTDAPVAGATNNPGPGSLTFYYTNQQSARLMFYHDHAYGITRLNVYAGEAAAYLLTDSLENQLVNSGVLPSSAGEYLYGIPLVIQDKTFVDASTIAYQDPTWAWGSTAPIPHTGDLWMPHVYMPNQNPYDVSGANPYGRWDYGPWFFPPTPITNGPVPNPYYDPINAPWEPPMIPGVPTVSAGMEAFMDTPTVNGEAYPYLDVEPQAYRFRVLNAANDRFFNLQMYVADSSVVTSDGRMNTEVKMVPALATPGFPATWPSDGRVGGVPDPATAGPSWVQIGTEGGFLPAPAEIPNQPVTWNYNMKTFNFGNVQDHSLLLGTAERADVIVDFSQFAGKTIIVYNDAPAGFPAYDPRSDYYTGDLDQTSGGGAPTTQAGFGPNTRTIMQIRVAAKAPAPVYDVNALKAIWEHTSEHKGVFEQSQDPILVPTSRYDSAYGMSFPADQYVRIQDTSMTFTTIDGTSLTLGMEPKAIHDEMGGSYDTIYGRMMGSLGLEVPTGNAVTQMFIPLGYASPPVELLKDSVIAKGPTLGDGTQIWKITHNGVDTHTIHVHLFNAQLINAVAWDNTMLLPDDNELGWKETIRVDPLSDTIIAMRPISPKLPFELPNSIREIDPTMPDGDPLLPPAGGFIDPNANPVTVNNHLINYGAEYVVHCHLLEHEEMDMMHAIVFATSPWAPKDLTGTFAGTTVSLSWTDGSISETGYWIQRSSNGGPWSTVATINIPLNTITPTRGGTQTLDDTVVADGTVYSYRVMAIKTVGDTFDYGGGAGYPSLTMNSTPTNTIDVNTGNGQVTIHALPPPPVVPTPPGPTAPAAYRAPLPLVRPAASGLITFAAHAPIRIDSNAGFTAANGVSGGSGTPGSPWIIQNLRINAADKGYGMYIGNTTQNFIVRNNVIENASSMAFSWPFAPDSGIVMNNVMNGVAAYNTLNANAWSGVFVQGSQMVTVFNNLIKGSSNGIYMTRSSNNTVAWNNITACDAGLWLDLSDLNGISGNTIMRNYQGIVLAGSNANTMTDNSLYLNSDEGIFLHGSVNNYVHDNDIIYNHGSTTTRSPMHVQAFDDGTSNRWNTGARGNHWADWTTPDANADGIVDVSYLIDGGTGATDLYPLVLAVKPVTLTTVVATPSPVSVVRNATQAFSAQGYSQYGDLLTGLIFTWSTNVGTMTGSTLTAQAAVGTVGYVRATSGAVSGNAIVTITVGPLAYINVTPATANVVVGSLALFSAFGTDAYYNVLTGLVFTWTTNVGTITSTGLFTAQTTPGAAGFVSATNGTVTGSSVVTILLAPLSHIVVSPFLTSVVAGGTQTFTATGYDQLNNVMPGLTFTWMTNAGTMTGSTLTAQTTAGGMGVVIASSGFTMGFAFVTIVPGALHHIDVAPPTVNVVTGSQTLFTASGKDIYNNLIPGLVYSWTTNAGTISSTGLLTAQMTPMSSGQVSASVGPVTGSAVVNVIALTPSNLTIVVSPSTANVAAGGTQTFTAVAYDQANNVVPGVIFSWSTTVGTIVNGVLTAQTLAGVSGFVTATSGTSSGQAAVTIVPGPLSAISVLPVSATVTAGSQTQFAASGRDSYGNVISGLTFTWGATIGSITQGGLWTAPTTAPTSGSVTATASAVTGSAAVNTVAGSLTSIAVTPATASVVAGATQAFSAVGHDVYGNTVPGVVFTWSTNVGTMTGSTLTAQAVAGASGYVRATSGAVFGDALVTIVPGPLNHIDLTPASLSAPAGSQTQFSAIGRDILNNAIAGLTFTWTSTIGTISSTGLFTAPAVAGTTGSVSASVGAITGSASVTVVAGQLSYILVTPATANVVANANQVFTAAGYDALNNLITGLSFTWSTNVGMMMSGNTFMAQTTAGVTGYVRATSGLVSGDAIVTIVPGALNHIDVAPATLSAAAGSQTQFTAVGRDVYNNAIAGLTFAWATNVGTISASGLFTAQTTAGATGTVTATSGGITGTASVTIIAAPLSYIIVTPGTASVVVGTTQSFSAVGYDALNNVIPGVTFTWSSNVGTVSGAGLLTAQTVTGVGYVRATNGLVSGNAAVTILPGALNHIDVTPATLTAVQGTQTQFTATGRDVYNNAIPGLTFTWSATVGLISTTGLFTAESPAGSTGFVNAASGGFTGTASVSITSAVSYIVVTPSSTSVVAGMTQTFTAVGYNSLNQVIPGLTFTWTTNVGTISASGTLTAQTASGLTGYVRATNGLVSGSAIVIVTPGALSQIAVTPSPAIVVAGTQAQFTATGKDVYNNVITGLTFSWTTNVGTVSASGLFTAQSTAGVSGTVSASSGLVTGSASVSIVSSNSPPVLTPLTNMIVNSGTVVTLTGNAVDPDLDPIRYTWNFGDGTPKAVGQTVTHIYTKPGIFTLTLYADDLTGLAGHNVSSSAKVTVPFIVKSVTPLAGAPSQGIGIVANGQVSQEVTLTSASTSHMPMLLVLVIVSLVSAAAWFSLQMKGEAFDDRKDGKR